MKRARLGVWRLIKWAAAAVLVLFVGWVLTRSSGVLVVVSGWFGIYLGEHRIAVYTVQSSVPSQIVHGPMYSRAHGVSPWTFDWTRTPTRLGVTVPLWAATFAAALAFAGTWGLETRSRRRQSVGFWPRCRYDLKGIATGSTCPECGASVVEKSKCA